jgi:tetratricopeptide (TPR) repeat protein
MKHFDTYKKQLALAAASSAALAFLMYLPSLSHGFVLFDDHKYIYQNPYLNQPFSNYLTWSFESFYFSNWHPFTWLLFKLEHMAWGINPVGYHLVSIVLHSANSALVTIMSAGIFRLMGNGIRDKAVMAALITGAVFAIHPIHVESVSWASESKDLLYSIFWLLGILFYLSYARSAYKSSRSFLLCSLMFAFSLLSKPMAVTFPAVLLIIDFYPLERFSLKPSKEFFRAIMEKLPLFAMSAGLSVLTVLAQSYDHSVAGLQLFPVSERILNVPWTLGFYMLKSFIPLDLTPFYPHRIAAFPLTLDYWLAILFTLAVALWCVLAYKRNLRWPLAITAYIFITLLPTLGLVQVGAQMAADRYMYLPLLGILLPLALYISLLRNKINKKALLATGIIIAITLSTLTIKQQSVWKNSDTLWNYIIIMEPRDTKARLARAELNSGRGKFELAIEDLTWVINYFRENRFEPSHWPPHVYFFRRGSAYLKIGDFANAVRDLSAATLTDPSNPDYYYKRAIAYKNLNILDEAEADYIKTISLSPEHVSAYNNIASVYMAQGKAKEALDAITKAIALDPENGKYYRNRSKILSVLEEMGSSQADADKTSASGYLPARNKLRTPNH